MALTPPPSGPPAAPTAPGDAPSRANPSTFRELADAFVVWQVGFRDWLAGMVAWLASYISWAGTNVAEMDTLQTDVQSNADAVATDAAAVATSAAEVAANRTALDNRLYPGTYAADPVTRPDGSAVQAGDRYFNSSIARQKTYSGAVWATDNLDSAALAGAGGASLVGFRPQAFGPSRPLSTRMKDWQDVADWAPVGDGTYHPLSERYATLAQAQADYPVATALTDDIDWTAFTQALALLPNTRGGELGIPSPATAYHLMKTLDLSSKQGVRLTAAGGRNFKGTSGVIIQAGTAAMTLIKSDAGALVHAGPGFENLTLKDAAGGGSLLLYLNAINRWRVMGVNFVGNGDFRTVGLRAKSSVATIPASDNGWGRIDAPSFQQCAVAIDAPDVFGMCVTGGEVTAPTNLQNAAAVGIDLGGRSQHCKILGTKFDGGLISLRMRGAHCEAVGCSMEGGDAGLTWTGVVIDSDGGASGFADSGKYNRVLGGDFVGRGGAAATGANIGSGAQDTTILRPGVSNLTTKIVDSGARSAIWQGDGAIQLKAAGTANMLELWRDGTLFGSFNGSGGITEVIGTGFGRITKLGAATSAVSFNVRDSSDVSLGQIFGDGTFRLGKAGGTGVYTGGGSPEGVITASPGSIFLRTNGGATTSLYVKESGVGNTGWIAK